MRVGTVVGLSPLIGTTAAAGALAEETSRAKTPALEGSSLLSEFRLGFAAQDPWGREKGSANAAAELLFAKPFTAADLFTSYFVPRPHVGGALNFDTKTSYAYVGLTWAVDVTPWVFIEGSLGGAIHNGSTEGHLMPPGRQALGCSPLFREAGSIGVRLSDKWSMTATVERLSNGGTCGENKGLTNVGARLGYSF